MLALSKVGLIIIESTSILPDGWISKNNFGLQQLSDNDVIDESEIVFDKCGHIISPFY